MYENHKKELYKSQICEIIEIIADLIDQGYQVELSRSRSGVKLYSVSKRHHVIRHKGGNEDA